MRSHHIPNGRAGVSNVVFAISSVILIIIAASGFGLYATSQGHSSTATSSEMMSHISTSSEMTTATSTSSQNGTCACEFAPQSGAMISNAWLISTPLRTGEYAIAIHAEGLEPNGTYLVEGSLSSISMQVVPISNASMSMNEESASEFQANPNGTGQFWIELGSNPLTTFESINLVFLPGMSMQNATLVATVKLAPTMTSESSAMTTTISSMTGENMSG